MDAETAGEGSFPPHDYALGAKGYGVTAEEQAFGEPLDMRLGRERPDQPTEDEYGGNNEEEPARTHLHKILGWALVAATVGLVLRSLEQKAGLPLRRRAGRSARRR